MNRNGELSKADAIRRAIKSARRPLSVDEMLPIVEEMMRRVIGRTRLKSLCESMKTNGALTRKGDGELRAYGLAKGK